jgi:crotonobetainyl-CoA:carnitine CoA-transferase CaiB-like acyl-CoA transferase
VIFGIQANRGKRSLLVDLKTSEGQDILHRLVQDVDIVTANVLDRQLISLGLDLERLRASNPNIILCQLDAFGGPQLGPRSGYPGYDDLVQASTGIMARFGGSLATPEEHAHLGTIDVLTGFCAAFAIGVALIKRVRGGGADVARASLAAAGQLIQIPFMYDYGERAAFDEPSGPHVKGEHALYRCYEARDGWFFLAAKRCRLADFTSIPELSEITTIPEQELEAYLAQCFKQKSLSYWVEAWRRLDVGIHVTETMASVREANLFPEHVSLAELRGRTWAFIRHDPHPSGHRVDLVAPHAVRALNARIEIPAPAPQYGAHTREILAELGYDTSQIDGLLAQGIIAESWSDDYLPD